jgi:hypothetical protein
MGNNNQFMLLFRFEPNFDHQPSESEMNEMHQSWGAFIGNLAIQEKLISTHQLGFEGKQISANCIVTEGIHIAESNTLGGNMIVKASNIDDAVEIAKNCPILAMGGSVEVRSINPM